jgi:hypothetical protein
VWLKCCDHTIDYKGTSWSTATEPLATGELPAPTDYTFTLTLPAAAPICYSDGGVGIWWEVEARCDVFGTDVRAVTRLDVAVSDRVPA